MYPNFDIGDQLTVDKVSKRWREYERRDVVVFNPPPKFNEVVGGDRSGDALIKRIVAVAGDTVEIKNGGTLYLNGEAQDEPFTNEAFVCCRPCGIALGSLESPALLRFGHCCFVSPGRPQDMISDLSKFLKDVFLCWVTTGMCKISSVQAGPTSRLGGSGKLSGPEQRNQKKPRSYAADNVDTASTCAKQIQKCPGRIVNVYGGFGFFKKLGDADGQDIFFRAADVIGMNSLDPGSPSTECLEIVQANTRNSNGFKKFYITLEDEVSFVMSKDHTGKPCAAAVMKERKGAWRTSTGRRRIGVKEVKKETFKDQVNRLTSMDTDQILQSAMFFKEILDSPEFDGIHLYKVVSMLASKDLLEDTRADRIYRLFLESSAMQACLRTTIIKQGAGRHNGNFLEECLKVIVEIVMRSPASQELRGQLPLVELVEVPPPAGCVNTRTNWKHGNTQITKDKSEWHDLRPIAAQSWLKSRKALKDPEGS
ncbi:unnamed protein product [Cladocopium goreaui]|uniref:Mitochondrial inner membrane protease subunit n=1 Tax=Cladocopium goreaui TaxID=2562237 RepID=A0A9P1FX61_9DINO|nr:unnamed protein product [Cladocopium goreaui]